jgi:hypothetical protein
MSTPFVVLPYQESSQQFLSNISGAVPAALRAQRQDVLIRLNGGMELPASRVFLQQQPRYSTQNIIMAHTHRVAFMSSSRPAQVAAKFENGHAESHSRSEMLLSFQNRAAGVTVPQNYSQNNSRGGGFHPTGTGSMPTQRQPAVFLPTSLSGAPCFRGTEVIDESFCSSRPAIRPPGLKNKPAAKEIVDSSQSVPCSSSLCRPQNTLVAAEALLGISSHAFSASATHKRFRKNASAREILLDSEIGAGYRRPRRDCEKGGQLSYKSMRTFSSSGPTLSSFTLSRDRSWPATLPQDPRNVSVKASEHVKDAEGAAS